MKFGWFMFTKLPSAWFCGVRLTHLDEAVAKVTVPYKWLSQNPFNSIYFACQAMAAEFSTGMLAMGHLYKRQPAVSMLVIRMESSFVKKATGKIEFVCSQGHEFSEAVDMAISTMTPQTLIAKSTGRNAEGDVVSEFLIEWSFKARPRQKP